MAARKRPWLKPGVLIGGLVPLAVLGGKLATKSLGADPVAIALNQLGLLALTFLLASLATTPLRLAFGWSFASPLRRMLGLFAFFYATLHVLTYAVVDQGLAWPAIGKDITERPFIVAGFWAFLCLIPLALTSTAASQKRMGGEAWRRLHRLAYVAAILAALHFVWRVKRDISQPAAYAFVLAVLFAVRLYDRAKKPLPEK